MADREEGAVAPNQRQGPNQQQNQQQQVPIFRALGNTAWPQLQNLFRGKGIQSWVIHVNNYFMHGDHSILMTKLKP